LPSTSAALPCRKITSATQRKEIKQKIGIQEEPLGPEGCLR
jgi:hypothetical protein